MADNRASSRTPARLDRGARAAAGHSAAGAAGARLARVATQAAVVIVLFLSLRGECWAYIDPNAGGFLAQILAPLGAIFLSFLFYCRRRIKRLVKSARARWRGLNSRGGARETRE